MEALRTWVQEHFFPVVFIQGTPAAEQICHAANGLSLVDVLRPYGQILQVDAPLRVGEASVRVKEVRLRFYATQSMFQPKTEVIDESLKEVLTSAAMRCSRMDTLDDLLQHAHDGTLGSMTPWFTEYREEFLRMMLFGEHETFDHPLAGVYVVPSTVLDPVSHFEALKVQTPEPPLMTRGVMYPIKDSAFPKHYVLLHDGTMGIEANMKRAQDNLALIQKNYGAAHCSLLTINSGLGEPGAPPEIYRRYRNKVLPGGGAGEADGRPQEPPQGLGAYLSPTDLDAIATFLRHFTVNTLLPGVEERIARLNSAITVTRRGFKNRITRFLKTGPSEGPPTDAPYPHSSIESQMRQLADLAFMFHHYDLAVSTYRLAAADYQSHHNNKWYAGAEEMIGLCHLLEPQEGSEPVKYLIRAYENYSKLTGKHHRMLATRAMLWCGSYQQAAGRYLSANHLLMRAHFEEENARAALLLEQAAHALLRVQPPSIRKFAFHMVLAGLRFHSCGQKQLAINAYRQVTGIYHHHEWRFIEEHLNDLLGKQLREGADYQGAMTHFMHLLECLHRPPATQQHYLTQFLEAVKKVEETQGGTAQVVSGLGIPSVNTTDVTVIFDDQHCTGNQGALQFSEAHWRRLESSLTGVVGDSQSSNWLEGLKQVVDHEEYNTCVVGEEVLVKVEFKNNLQVKLRITEAQLVCEFRPQGGPSTSHVQPVESPSPLHLPLGASGHSTKGHPLAPRPEQVQVGEGSFTLHPGEKMTEQLAVRPMVPGWLRIVGVQWRINDGVCGEATFNIKGRKRKKPKGDRPAQQKHYPPHKRLLFNVVAGMGKLEVTLEKLPLMMYQGELVRCSLVLFNSSTQPLKNIKMVTSTQDVMAVNINTGGTLEKAMGELSLGASEEKPRDTVAPTPGSTADVLNHLQDLIILHRPGLSRRSIRAHALYYLGEGMILGPGKKLSWPIWIYARSSGLMEFQGAWYWEQEGASGNMRYRTLRAAYGVQVQPLLQLSSSVRPLPHHLYDYQLELAVSNTQREGEVVQLVRCVCEAGSQEDPWTMSFPTGGAACEAAGRRIVPLNVILPPNQVVTLQCRLHPPGSPGAGSVATEVEEGAVARGTGPLTPAPDSWGLEGGPLQMILRRGRSDSSIPVAQGSSKSLAEGSGMAIGNVGPSRAVDVAVVWTIAGAPGGRGAAQPRLGLMAVMDVLQQGPGSHVQAEGQGTALGSTTSGVSTPAPHPSQVPPLAPIRLILEGPGKVVHDFRKAILCVVPLRLTIRNCSEQDPVDLLVETDTSSPATAAGTWVRCLVPSRPVPAPQAHHSRSSSTSVVPSGPLTSHGDLRASSLPPSPSTGYHSALSASSMMSDASFSSAPTPPPSAASSFRTMGGPSVSTVPLGPLTANVPFPGPPLLLPAPLLSEDPRSGPLSLPPCHEYIWCGEVARELPQVAPGGVAVLSLQVAVFRPGCYFVSGYSCSYAFDQKEVQGSCAGTPLLLVVEAVAGEHT